MRKLLQNSIFILLAILCFSCAPEVAGESNFEESVNRIIEESVGPYLDIISNAIFFAVPLGGGASMPFVIIWLLVGAAFFTYYMRFINFRGFKHAIDIVRGRYDDPNDPGEVSHFQALTAAL